MALLLVKLRNTGTHLNVEVPILVGLACTAAPVGGAHTDT